MMSDQSTKQLLIANRYGKPVAVAAPPPAIKRAASTVHWDGWGGAYGEAPPVPVTATPTQFVESEAVYAAVTAYANLASSTELHLYERQSDGELEEVKTHPGLDVLQNPNPFTSRFLLFWLLTADLLLNGNHWWFLAGPRTGAPVEIWRCNPRHTRIVRDKARYVAGYVTEVDGQIIPITVGESLHFKMPNPVSRDELYGVGPLTAAALAAQTGKDMAVWNRNMFGKNYAVPAGIVSIEKANDEDWAAIKRDWRSAHGKGQRRTAFARGSGLEFTSIGLTQTDVDFLRGAQWEAEKVLRVFGTYHLLPAQFADDRKVNERLFLEGHAHPLLTHMAEALTDDFFTFWGPSSGTGQLVARFDDIRPRERALDLDEDQEEKKLLTFNEARVKNGLKPLTGWDDVLFVHVQAGATPIDEDETADEQPVDAQPAADDADESDAEKPKDAQERAETRESAADDVGDDVGERHNKAADLVAVGRELTQWQRFEVKRFGADHDRTFQTEHIPAALEGMIRHTLTGCADADAVKAVFQQARGLAGGDLAASGVSFETPEDAVKGSYGTPSGSVVLYLSGVEDVLLVQQALQRSIPADAPVRWTPREQLHITLLYSPLVDEAPFRDTFQEQGFGEALHMRTTGFAVFGEGEQLALVMLVEPSEELRAMQAEVYQSFAARGLPISEFSQPDAWTPHITLAYFEARHHDLLNLDAVYEVGCTADVLAFTRGDYTNIHMRSGLLAPPLVVVPDGSVPDEAIKAIQATRLLFEADFEDLLAAARNESLDRRTWAVRMRTLLQRYGNLAFRDGLTDGGAPYGENEPLDPDDRAVVNAHIAAHSKYVTELGRVLFRTDNGVSDAQAALKPVLWFNKSIMPLYQAGKLSAARNMPHLWLHNPLKKNCLTCVTASGQIHRLKHWHKRGIIPLADILFCRGFACGCQLIAAPGERARGRLDRIPVLGGKVNDHTEDDVSVRWPDSVPSEIVAEFERVLGRCIKAVSGTDNQVQVTLSEEAGYYESLIDDDVRQGLEMIDPRLTLVTRPTIVGETDIHVTFTWEAADASDNDTDA